MMVVMMGTSGAPFQNVSANGFRLVALLGTNTGVGARRVHEGKHRQAEFSAVCIRRKALR